MDRPTDLHILANSELYRDLAGQALEEVRAICSRRRIAMGQTLFRAGEPAAQVYIVLAGRLRVSQTTASGQQIIIRYVGASEVAGYSTISGVETYNSTATAVDDTSLMSWSRPGIQRLMERHPKIAVSALGLIQARYREMQARVRELSTENVDRRVARAILRLAQQAGRRTATGIEIVFPLSRQDLAEMTGTTLHTVSRTLSAWEADGIIDGGRRRVVVRDPHKLALIGGDDGAE